MNVLLLLYGCGLGVWFLSLKNCFKSWQLYIWYTYRMILCYDICKFKSSLFVYTIAYHMCVLYDRSFA